MEALTITSRNVTNDKVFEKLKEEEYQRHIKKVQEIKDITPQRLKAIEIQNDKIAKVLRKAKEAAHTFEVKERDIMRKKENKILLEKLWRISEGKTPAAIPRQDDKARVIQHHLEFQKRVSEKILTENRYLAKNLVEQTRNVKSKSQIKSQIKQYLQLRDSIRKVRPPSALKTEHGSTSRLTRSESTAKKAKSVRKHSKQQQGSPRPFALNIN